MDDGQEAPGGRRETRLVVRQLAGDWPVKWFFCWCQDTEPFEDHGWVELIGAAVESARRYTDLDPHFLYDGAPSELTEALERAGVAIHPHRLSFADAISTHINSSDRHQAVARSAFMRFDIPLYTNDDDGFVLYTDLDVQFTRAWGQLKGYRPPFVAAAPQAERGSVYDMNSGVMVMNVPAWRACRDELLAFTRAHLHLGLDQEILRAWLGTDFTLLPDRYNWKPYWGVSEQAALIHWHGPKPVAATQWQAGVPFDETSPWGALYCKDRDAYSYYLVRYEELIAGWRLRSAPSEIERAARALGLSWPLPVL